MRRKTLLSLSFLAFLSLSGCGGVTKNTTTPPPSPTITAITVSCVATSLQTGQTSQCSAAVSGTGSYSSSVTWSATSGTISSSGLYTAPSTAPAAGSDNVKATSTEDPTKLGSAKIAITAPNTDHHCGQRLLRRSQPPDRTNQPVFGDRLRNRQLQFQRRLVRGFGTVSSSGLYTAPAAVPASGSDSVKATSVQDSTKLGSAKITITAPAAPIITGVSLACSPSTITDTQTASCTPTVTGTGAFANTVNFSISPAAAGTLSDATAVSSGTPSPSRPQIRDQLRHHHGHIDSRLHEIPFRPNHSHHLDRRSYLRRHESGRQRQSQRLPSLHSHHRMEHRHLLRSARPEQRSHHLRRRIRWPASASRLVFSSRRQLRHPLRRRRLQHHPARFRSPSSITPVKATLPLAPFPITAPIEGAPADCDGWPNTYIGDSHVLVLDRHACMLYETFNTHRCSGAWSASSETIWDLKNYDRRPWGWTSADAAGLPIFPGLVRYDEVAAGAINHAIRFTMQQTKNDANGGYFVAPASHAAGTTYGVSNIMGMRIRLKASFDISGYSAANQVILTAMKKYGMILADNGSYFYFQGVPDPRWNDDDLHNLDSIQSSNFEVVQMTPAFPGYDANTAPTGEPPVINSFTSSASSVAAGTPVTLTWNTTNDSYDFIDELGGVSGGTVTTTPTKTTTYTLNATNQYGRTTMQVTVTVH